jgi:tryptophan-rich sensory protein
MPSYHHLFKDKMKMGKIVRFIIAILICQLAGIIGSLFTTPSIPTWYASLEKPSFAPPNWLFGPVWITLFTLMGISFYLVWNKGLKNKMIKKGLFIFGIQLFLNVLWSFLFFGLRSPLYGFIEIIVLWIAIGFTILKFYRISKNAALLLLPYIAWVSVAATLNYYIWILNV